MGASFFFPQRRVEMGSTSGIHHAGRPCGRLCIVLFVFFLISGGASISGRIGGRGAVLGGVNFFGDRV